VSTSQVPNSEILNRNRSCTCSFSNSSCTTSNGWRFVAARKSRPMSLRDSSASRSARGSGSEPYVVYVPDLGCTGNVYPPRVQQQLPTTTSVRRRPPGDRELRAGKACGQSALAGKSQRGRIDRLRKWPSAPMPTNSPTVPCASGPRLRSCTINAGCSAVPT
jgi:hypothetical protein